LRSCSGTERVLNCYKPTWDSMARIVAFLLALAAAGCVSIDGGAIEASWDIHAMDGRGISDCSCTCPEITQVRFSVVPAAGGADLCLGKAVCQFPCRAKHGATPFDIPPGAYAVSLVPLGADGQDLTGAIAGDAGAECSVRSGVAPTLRTVGKGQLTQMNGVLIQAGCALVCGGSDSTRVCTQP
jgi:hypothetical protein